MLLVCTALHCTALYCTVQTKKICYTMVFNKISIGKQRQHVLTTAQDSNIYTTTPATGRFLLQKTRFIWHISTIKKVSASVKHAYNQTRTRLSNVIFLFVLSFRYIFSSFFYSIFSLVLATFFINCSHSEYNEMRIDRQFKEKFLAFDLFMHSCWHNQCPVLGCMLSIVSVG